MSMVWWVVIGVVAGGAGGAGIMYRIQATEEPVVAPAPVATAQLEVQKQLSDLDLIKPVCAPEYVEKQGDLLCRELFCRMVQRGIDGTTKQDCEQISNMANKMSLWSYCSTQSKEDPDIRRVCIELFDRRL